MKPYLLSLGAGLLIGAIYSLLQVRSPAPPVIALVGLLGILGGEQLPSLVSSIIHHKSATMSWANQIRPHVFGRLPTGRTPNEAEPAKPDSRRDQLG